MGAEPSLHRFGANRRLQLRRFARLAWPGERAADQDRPRARIADRRGHLQVPERHRTRKAYDDTRTLSVILVVSLSLSL